MKLAAFHTVSWENFFLHVIFIEKITDSSQKHKSNHLITLTTLSQSFNLYDENTSKNNLIEFL